MRPCATWASRSVHPNQAGPRLRDVGFEIVPPLSARNEALAEVPLVTPNPHPHPHPHPHPNPNPNPNPNQVPLVLLILFTIVSLLWSLYDSAPAGERLTPSVV